MLTWILLGLGLLLAAAAILLMTPFSPWSSSNGASDSGPSPHGHGSVPPTESGGPQSPAPDGVQGVPGSLSAMSAFFGSQFVVTEHGAFGWDRTETLPPDQRIGTGPLRVRYPANSASQRSLHDDNTSDGGAQAYLLRQQGRLDEAWLSYDLRFPTGFVFVKGGKLPGMFGGTVTSGRHIPDGTDGFSTRFMWRTGGAGEVYAYLPTSVAHGTSLGRGDWTWPTGRWTHVVQHVRLNTPGVADGLVEVWIDGVKVLTKPELEFRTSPDLKIEGLFFSTFFGGGDSTWASPVDQSAEFGRFQMSDRPLR